MKTCAKNLRIEYECNREIDSLVEKERMQLLCFVLALVVFGFAVLASGSF